MQLFDDNIYHLNEREEYTPDFSQLRMFDKVGIFVYGLEQKGHFSNYYLDGADYIGKALTMFDKFEMKEDGHFSSQPVVFNKVKDAPFAYRVMGELYLGSVQHVHILDRLHQNGQDYNRSYEKVWVDNNDLKWSRYQNMPYCNAFMYIGDRSYWRDTKPMKPDLNSAIFPNKTYYHWGFNGGRFLLPESKSN